MATKPTKPAPRIPNRPSAGNTITSEWGQAVHDDIVAKHMLSGEFRLNFSGSNSTAQWFPYRMGGGSGDYQFNGGVTVILTLMESPNSFEKITLSVRTRLDDIFEVLAATVDASAITMDILVGYIAIGNRR